MSLVTNFEYALSSPAIWASANLDHIQYADVLSHLVDDSEMKVGSVIRIPTLNGQEVQVGELQEE